MFFQVFLRFFNGKSGSLSLVIGILSSAQLTLAQDPQTQCEISFQIQTEASPQPFWKRWISRGGVRPSQSPLQTPPRLTRPNQLVLIAPFNPTHVLPTHKAINSRGVLITSDVDLARADAQLQVFERGVIERTIRTKVIASPSIKTSLAVARFVSDVLQSSFQLSNRQIEEIEMHFARDIDETQTLAFKEIILKPAISHLPSHLSSSLLKALENHAENMNSVAEAEAWLVRLKVNSKVIKALQETLKLELEARIIHAFSRRLIRYYSIRVQTHSGALVILEVPIGYELAFDQEGHCKIVEEYGGSFQSIPQLDTSFLAGNQIVSSKTATTAIEIVDSAHGSENARWADGFAISLHLRSLNGTSPGFFIQRSENPAVTVQNQLDGVLGILQLYLRINKNTNLQND